jgi:hypothetical protein
MKKVKEAAEQRKLRKAQELIEANKKKQQEEWRAKWEAQQKDPEYVRKTMERREKSEERSRKMAIGKENAWLARQKMIEHEASLNQDDLEHTAYHESGHAVVHEVLSNGVSVATIVPRGDESKSTTNSTAIDVKSLGHVTPNGKLPIPKRQQTLVEVACLLAGGLATEFAGFEPWGTGGDDKMIADAMRQLGLQPNTKEYVLFEHEASDICWKLFEDPKVWQAVEDVKDMLLVEKTISGADVRAIVKKQHYPKLVPIEVTRQLYFHYRKNRVNAYDGSAPFVIGINVHNNTYGFYGGYTLTQPAYVNEVIKANTQPVPFPVNPVKVKAPTGFEYTLPFPSQVSFQFPSHAATPVAAPAGKVTRRKKGSAA